MCLMSNSLHDRKKEEYKRSEQEAKMGCAVGVFGAIVLIIGLMCATYYGNLNDIDTTKRMGRYLIFGGIAVIICSIFIFKTTSNKTKQVISEFRKEEAESLNDYLAEKKRYNIPNNAKFIRYKSGYADLFKSSNYIWIDEGNLCFFPTEKIAVVDNSKVILYKIPLDKIEYYATKGELVHENKITGGGGGGSSIGGAVVGGVIAGGVGAVIGSRKKNDPIKSELITHDRRETFINFFNDKDEKHSMFFDFDAYNIFIELMPEKAFEIVSAIKANAILNKVVNESKSSSITDQIRELAKLKDEGILTEEEFNNKKKELLDKIN